MRAHLNRFESRWRWLAVLPLACCLSCSSSNLNSVQGKVLYNDQPLKGVLVSFHPKAGADLNTKVPQGYTGEDGTFTVTTGDAAGAAAGEYLITFICSEDVPPPKGKPMSMGMGTESVDKFKGRYADKSALKVEVEIKPGLNQLEAFHLK